MSRPMKDSGYSWLGTVPDSWQVRQVKDGFYQKKEKAHQEDPVVLSLARSGVKVRDMSNAEGQFAESYYDYNPVAVRDMLLNPMDLISGDNCSISAVEGVISPAYVNLRYKEGIYPEFYHYYFKYQYWCMSFFAHGKGVSFDNRWTLNNETLMHYPLLVPSLDEQKRIADFLDRKSAEIDTVIKKTEESIEEYKKLKQSIITEAVTKGIRPGRKMKPSGIEWIGDIPEEWIVRKGKWVLTKLERPLKEDDGVITCFRDGEVTLRSNRREEGFTFSMQEAGYQGIEPGDLVVHGMDGFAGAIGISDSRGKATPVLNVLDSTKNKKYIMYYLRSMAFNGVFLALATGIRVRTCDTNWNKLKELPYPIPSIEEQQEIAEYIDDNLKKIDKLIETKQKAVEELQTYKKSVIYEYVTGKKEVPVC